MPRLAILALLVGCEMAGPANEAIRIVPPDSPEVETMRIASTEHDPPPPAAAPIAPDLVGMFGPMKRWYVGLALSDRKLVREICRMRLDNPCWGLMPGEPGDGEHPLASLVATVPRADEYVDRFCQETTGGICDTPLVVAFDGQPIDIVASPGRFTFSQRDVASDWPTAKTPWIALDRDGDGEITSGAELFGNGTPGGATNGFEALARLDDNRDGVIDRDDRAFASLLLWADANADRRSTPEELRPLSSTIVSIPLAYEMSPRCTRGNCEGERGTFTWRDASGVRTGAVVDIYLRGRE